MVIWDKVFKSGLSKFCGRQPLKNLLSPLLNTLSHLKIDFFTNINEIIKKDIKNSLAKICLILNTLQKKYLEQLASEILQNGNLLDININDHFRNCT